MCNDFILNCVFSPLNECIQPQTSDLYAIELIVEWNKVILKITMAKYNGIKSAYSKKIRASSWRNYFDKNNKFT